MVILHCILLCFDGLVAVGFGNKIVGGIVAVVGMEMQSWVDFDKDAEFVDDGDIVAVAEFGYVRVFAG